MYVIFLLYLNDILKTRFTREILQFLKIYDELYEQ
jgi:hypothetical protein